jgi:hypothetical protein
MPTGSSWLLHPVCQQRLALFEQSPASTIPCLFTDERLEEEAYLRILPFPWLDPASIGINKITLPNAVLREGHVQIILAWMVWLQDTIPSINTRGHS